MSKASDATSPNSKPGAGHLDPKAWTSPEEALLSVISTFREARRILGSCVRDLRGKWGWTQRQLADALGITTVALSSIENGKTYPTRTTLEAIQELLDAHR